MDYEKEYKEALEKAKAIYQGIYKPDTAAIIAETLQSVFPELKESEESDDERIKKAIKYGLDYVFTNNTTIYEITKEQCLSWLEKQGEQKPAWSEEDEKKLTTAQTFIRNTYLYGNDGIKNATIDWLKSLKDRVQSKKE